MAQRICGVDLGGTKVEAVVVDRRRAVLGHHRAPTPAGGGPPAVVAAVAEAVRAAAEMAGVKPRALSGIGIGAPGAVDAKRGVLRSAPNLDGFAEPVRLARLVADAVGGVDVRLGNDVAVAVLGELELGAGRDLSSFVGIWWGTGVGGGVVLDRRLWRGRGNAGEIGHTVVQRDGLAEPNGLVGTLEAYAGRRSLEARARALAAAGRATALFTLMEGHGRDRLSSRIWQEALAQGDALAEELIADAVDAIAVAAANAVNLLDLEAVVLGGGLGSRFGEPMAARLAAAMRPRLFLPDKAPPVRLAALGDQGGAIGASLLVEA